METKRELLIKEAIKRGLTPTNLKNIYCLFDFDNEVNQEYYDKLGYYYYEAEYDRLWIQNGSFLDICIYHNSQWAYLKEETYENIVHLETSKITDYNPIETPKHYDNSKGSIYKFCENQKLNAWESDLIKRIVRCRKKGEFRQDLEKTKHLIDLYLKEYEQGT